MGDKIKIVCSCCGSENVRKDAWAEWDTESQEWVLAQAFDGNDYCEDCAGECSLDEVPLIDSPI